jgi:hypothetical protein
MSRNVSFGLLVPYFLAMATDPIRWRQSRFGNRTEHSVEYMAKHGALTTDIGRLSGQWTQHPNFPLISTRYQTLL